MDSELYLPQTGAPTAYASQALTKTQAQIEKETLAIVGGCQKFYQYFDGKHLLTDHMMPLETIFNAAAIK